MDFDQMFQGLVDMSYEELLDGARDVLPKVDKAIARALPKQDDHVLLELMLFAQAVAADGKFTPLEKQFIKDLLDINPDDMLKFIVSNDGKMVSEEAITLVDTLVDALNAEEKANVLLLVCTIAAVDEKINGDELKFFYRLMA